MARVKNVEAYCNVCGIIRKMEITGEIAGDENQHKKWAKCKKCKQTMVIEVVEKAKKEPAPSLENIENEDAVETYSPSKSFKVGQTIYHQNWDDYGKVISKIGISNGRSSITVEFQKSGQKKLIESIANEINNPQT